MKTIVIILIVLVYSSNCWINKPRANRRSDTQTDGDADISQK